MFRHKGKNRTFKHNFRLAIFLSFVAGLVNIAGVLALSVLTTNVTGHFAYFAEDILKANSLYAINFLLYIFSFLLGSFISSLLTEFFAARGNSMPHNTAICIEISLLFIVGLVGDFLIHSGFSKSLLASVLLFSMGMQNSLVSKISNAVVRTTHLTGLFTDLGIELSQLFFYKTREQYKLLMNSIKLRAAIIAFFFLGCIIGGVLYLKLKLSVLIIAALILIIALVYDNLRLGYYKVLKKLI